MVAAHLFLGCFIFVCGWAWSILCVCVCSYRAKHCVWGVPNSPLLFTVLHPSFLQLPNSLSCSNCPCLDHYCCNVYPGRWMLVDRGILRWLFYLILNWWGFVCSLRFWGNLPPSRHSCLAVCSTLVCISLTPAGRRAHCSLTQALNRRQFGSGVIFPCSVTGMQVLYLTKVPFPDSWLNCTNRNIEKGCKRCCY